MGIFLLFCVSIQNYSFNYIYFMDKVFDFLAKLYNYLNILNNFNFFSMLPVRTVRVEFIINM